MSYDIIGRIVGRIFTMLGFDGSDFRPLSVDVDGKLNVVTPDPVHVAGTDGFDWEGIKTDSQGRLQVNIDRVFNLSDSIPFLIYDRVLEKCMFTVTAGQNYVDSTPVPAGFFHQIMCVVYYDSNNAGTQWDLMIYAGGVDYILDSILGPVTNNKERISETLWLKEGDYLRARFTGAVVGDNIRMIVSGVKVRHA